MNYSQKFYKALKLNLCGKLVSPFESPTTFDQRFKVTFVPVFTGIPGITNIPEIQEPVFLILIN